MTVEIRPMEPEDALAIARQPSQQLQLGLHEEMTPEAALDLVENGEAWTAWRAGVPIALMGLRETFPGREGVAWAILSEGIGGAHLAITRHARHRIAQSPLVRIQAFTRVACPAEGSWAKAVGLELEAVLRKFGALSEDHLLYARVR